MPVDDPLPYTLAGIADDLPSALASAGSDIVTQLRALGNADDQLGNRTLSAPVTILCDEGCHGYNLEVAIRPMTRAEADVVLTKRATIQAKKATKQ